MMSCPLTAVEFSGSQIAYNEDNRIPRRSITIHIFYGQLLHIAS